MTPRQKLEALAECRTCLEHDPVYGRANRPGLWARLDAQEVIAAFEAAKDRAADALNAIRINGGMEPIVATTIPDGRVWEDPK